VNQDDAKAEVLRLLETPEDKDWRVYKASLGKRIWKIGLMAMAMNLFAMLVMIWKATGERTTGERVGLIAQLVALIFSAACLGRTLARLHQRRVLEGDLHEH
jgi:uncharacterized RDD family membrane protein YckC